MRWNLRMRAAECGIWKSTEMRRRLAEAGLEVSAGKMSKLWTSTPASVRLEELDVICTVLDCTPAELMICEPDRVAEQVAARRPQRADTSTSTAGASTTGRALTPRLGRSRSVPPA